jgi:FMN hydrolase / 5-amino-6-(5-phospho-D-ribitylamino)uracil phosphatase
VKDPFYEHMPPHFGMTFKELLAAKHPTTWLEFERGDINEDVALSRFWADGRAVDGTALRNMLVRISFAVLEEPSVFRPLAILER